MPSNPMMRCLNCQTTVETAILCIVMFLLLCRVWLSHSFSLYKQSFSIHRMICRQFSWYSTKDEVFFKTRGHLSRLAWPTQRDGLSCLASPRLALRCAAWPGKTNPDPCSRPVATSDCSHRYYNGIMHNARFFSVRQAVFLYKHECLK